MKKKFLALLLAFVMVAGMLPVSAFAAEGFSDMDGHWSQDAVNRWSEVKVLNGDENGNFNPDKEMTRAEFAQMLCNLMGYTEKAENTFTDVPDDAWYADAILKLNTAGVMSGVGGGMAAPNAPITREQAAVLLCRAMNIEPSQSANISFSDAHTVSDWARDAVAALTERGMINGMGDNSFAPALNINRASVATMVNNMVAEYVTEDGATVTGEVNGVVIVKADNVKIEDATLSENIIVAPAAQDATVTLTGATEAAGVVVAAEGAKVVVAETAAAGSVTVEAPKAEAQVAGKAGAIVVAETAEGAKTTVTATAEVTGVTVAAPKTETQLAGKVETVAVAETAEGAKATVAKTAEVKDMTVAAPKAETQVSGKVDTVAVTETASGANITANSGAAIGSVDTKGSDTTITANAGAKVENVTTSGEGVTVNGAKDTITNVTATGGSAEVKASGAEVKNDGADKVTVDGNKDVATGDKTTSNTSGTTGGSTSGGSSGGGSSSGGNEPAPVETADVVPAPLEDHAESNAIAADKLGTVTVSGTKASDKTYNVTITGTGIMNHTNAASTAGHWVGFGMPIESEDANDYSYTVGGTNVPTIADRKYQSGGKWYNTVYFSEATEGTNTYTVVQKKGADTVATYNVTTNVTFWKATGVTIANDMCESDKTYFGQFLIGSTDVKGTANVNGLTMTITGDIDVSKLNKNSGQDDPREYTYYWLKFTNTDSLIKTVTCNGASWTALDEITVATRIWNNTNSSLLKTTHPFQLKDAAGRVQDTVTVTVDATGASVAGKVKVTFMNGSTVVSAIVADKNASVTAPAAPEAASDKYFTGWSKDNGATLVAASGSVPAGEADVTYTAQFVDITTTHGAVRPSEPTGGTAYQTIYTNAGITYTNGVISVDQTKAVKYVNDSNNSTSINAIKQTSGSLNAEALFIGIAVDAPANAIKATIKAGDAESKDISVPSVDDAGHDIYKNGSTTCYIEYYPAILATGAAPDSNANSSWTTQIVWKGENDTVLKVDKLVVSRGAVTNPLKSEATFKAISQEVADLYKDWAGIPKTSEAVNISAFQEDVAFTEQNDSTIKVSGNLKPITEKFIGFNGAVEKEQTGYYLLFQFEAPKGTKEAAKGTIVKDDGTKKKEFTVDALDTVGTGDDAKEIFSFIWWLSEPVTEESQTVDGNIKLTIDWYGVEGTETQYTLDLSGLTLTPSTTPSGT